MNKVGKVFIRHQLVAEVEYDYSTRPNYTPVQTLDGRTIVPTVPDIRLRIGPVAAIAQYWSAAKMLTLHMIDGKRQNFYLRSVDGECEASGDPY